MFKYLLYFFCAFSSVFCFAQGSISNAEYPNTYKLYKQQQASKYINILKNGALLVQIQSKLERIEKYAQSNAPAVANRIVQERDREAKKLMESFEKHYNFSPVYFFFSHNTHRLEAGEKQGFFLNKNLEEDPSIVLKESDYLIFDKSIPIEEKVPDIYRNERVDLSSSERIEVFKKGTDKPMNPDEFYTGSSSGAETYIVLNSNFEQLLPPFPFITFNKLQRGLPKEIRYFNQRFHDFYNSVNTQK